MAVSAHRRAGGLPSAYTEEAAAHQPLFVLREHGAALLSASFYPAPLQPLGAALARAGRRSRLFLSGDTDGTVALWDLELRRPLLTFDAAVTAIAAVRAAAEAVESPREGDAHGGADVDGERAPGEHEDSDGLAEEASAKAGLCALRRALREGTAGGPTGVLGVGFLHVGTTTEVTDKGESGVDQQLVPLRTGAAGEGQLSAQTPAASGSSASARRRFRLSRRPPTGSEAARCGAEDGSDPLYFFTHCRSQRLHIWAYDLATATPVDAGPPQGGGQVPAGLQLLYTLHVPHTGFCPAAATLLTARSGPTTTTVTLLSLPGEGGGPHLTHWLFTACALTDVLGCAGAGSGEGAPVVAAQATHDGAEDAEAEVRVEVDVAGMDPMDALIARSAAREAAEARRAACARRRAAAAGPRPAFVAPSLATATGAYLRATFAGATSVLPAGFTVKSGMLMGVSTTALGARSHGRGGTSGEMVLALCAAFESGHVSVARLTLRFPSAMAPEGAGGSAENLTLTSLATTPLLHPPGAGLRADCHVLAAVRAFPEAATSCRWPCDEARTLLGIHRMRGGGEGEDTRSVVPGAHLIATSAEGNAQCFLVQEAAGSGAEVADRGADALSLVPTWSVALPKGIGSSCVLGHLLMLGGWDGTLRLLDLRGCWQHPGGAAEAEGHAPTTTTGALALPAPVSIFPFHVPSTVNSVCAAPSQWVAAEASFGFDARRPRLPPGMCSEPASALAAAGQAVAEVAGPASDAVHLFASASKDGRVAVWRVDFAALRERGKLLGQPLPPPLLPRLPIEPLAAGADPSIAASSH